ncbi:thiamine biosynthetic bifunctional enzyme [Vararia minispora EC-137]|uniref:Thiamine biosynthetic bifunctional enzyme n=1 Tax=Vararia minispora EC-137 TaxID=1314806 RepID=A0ACB8QZA1_9AGAM|nr:thiamine biosynthetic bifunctional enzyme [Vararia minispora EC-137]
MTVTSQAKPHVDYSVYLVTGRELLPRGKTYTECLEEALKGGVTVVQVREKTAETGEFLSIARQTIEICRRYNVPVLINDRIDIALASGADGIHVGQTDMPLAEARKLLPPNAIIGVSCNNIEHVKAAIAGGADYLGLGSIFPTNTKDVTEPGRIPGISGTQDMLAVLEGTTIQSVAIGGIKIDNLARVLHGCSSPNGHGLDGIAVVSEIMASPEPRIAAERLAKTCSSWKSVPRRPVSFTTPLSSAVAYVRRSAELLELVRTLSPLVHQITNNVVKTQSANATLALGGSPIMAAAAEEQVDLARIPGGLLINFGTVEDVGGMLAAGREANKNRKPIVFDPVGVGATAHRRATATRLLDAWQATVIKGNAAEIGAVAKLEEVASKGVDSVGSGFKDPATVVRTLARKQRCIVILSGHIDYISDGDTVIQVSNGHPLLSQITGSGCMLGTTVATFCGAASMEAEKEPSETDPGTLVKGDMLSPAVAGVLALTIASERAAARDTVLGPGSFLPALIDELSLLTPDTIESSAKITVNTL